MVQQCPYFSYATLLRDRTRGTYQSTLTAIGAGHLPQSGIEKSGDPGFQTPSREINGFHILHVAAYGHTASAEDAFLRVTHQ